MFWYWLNEQIINSNGKAVVASELFINNAPIKIIFALGKNNNDWN